MAAYSSVKGGKLKLKCDLGDRRKKSSKRKREGSENPSGSESGLLKHGKHIGFPAPQVVRRAAQNSKIHDSHVHARETEI